MNFSRFVDSPFRENSTAIGNREHFQHTVRIDGKTMTNRPAAEVARAGVAHIPEDRLATGLIGGMDLSENAILRDYFAQDPAAWDEARGLD